MATFFLALSAILFITTFGIYSFIHNAQISKFGSSTTKSSIIILALLSGFVLPVIPLTILLKINFIWIFLINIPVAWILGPIISGIVWNRFSSGKGLMQDILYSLIAGLAFLIIGISVNKNNDDETILEDQTYTNEQYKYEYRSGKSGDYQYNYDVNGYNSDGELMNGNVDMKGKYGTGIIEDENGNEKIISVEWVEKGQLEATDEDGNNYDLEVD